MERRSWTCVVLMCCVKLSCQIRDGIDTAKPANRACIIGAGYCGLGTARFMKKYGVNFTVFEATKYIGGTWRYDPRIGTDEDGLPLFTSMYKNLRINIPRMTMEYAGFPFPEGTQSYPTGECFYKYLKLFTKEFDLYKSIQFRSLVTSVKWVDDHWAVTYMKTDTKHNYTEECDFIAVANGEFSKPVLPKLKNQEDFKGTMIHSHDFRDPEKYRNRRLLVVGAGPSGLDMALFLTNVTAKLVHSHHRALNLNLSNTYVKKPDVKMFTSNGAIFQDDTFEELDDVIFCTGYNLSHGFLDANSGVVASNKFILPLYHHMVNIFRPSMVFIGTPRLVSGIVREVQAEYAAALAAGKFKLPSKEFMFSSWLSHVQSLKAQNMTINDVNFLSDMETYYDELTREAGVYRRPPVLTAIKEFNMSYRLEDLLNYRDFDYQIIDDHNYKRWYNPREGNPCPIDN